MGARVVLCDPHRAVVYGPSPLPGRKWKAPTSARGWRSSWRRWRRKGRASFATCGRSIAATSTLRKTATDGSANRAPVCGPILEEGVRNAERCDHFRSAVQRHLYVHRLGTGSPWHRTGGEGGRAESPPLRLVAGGAAGTGAGRFFPRHPAHMAGDCAPSSLAGDAGFREFRQFIHAGLLATWRFSSTPGAPSSWSGTGRCG